MKKFDEFMAIKKWENTKLLSLFEGSVKINAAWALDGQVAYNEGKTDDPDFLRYSIPLMVRVFAQVGDNLKGSSEELREWLDTGVDVPRFHVFNLNVEVEIVASLAEQLAKFIREGVEAGSFDTIRCFGIRGNRILANVQ